MPARQNVDFSVKKRAVLLGAGEIHTLVFCSKFWSRGQSLLVVFHSSNHSPFQSQLVATPNYILLPKLSFISG